MNNVLAIMFALAVLLAMSLGVIQTLRQTQLKINYTATAASLQQAVSEYVGAACGGGNRPIKAGDTIGFNATAPCSGNTVASLVHNGANVCAGRDEPGYIDGAQVDLHGATLEVVLDSTLPVLRLLHGGTAEARGFLAYLASSQSGWLAYDRDGDNVPDGAQWLLQTRASAAEGLWLAVAGADTSCTRWEHAETDFGKVPAVVTYKGVPDVPVMKVLACESWTETVRDDGGELCTASSITDCYDSASNSGFSAAAAWDYSRKRRFQDHAPVPCRNTTPP